MWPFDIFRKRRERLEQERREQRAKAYRDELDLQLALHAYRNARAAPMPTASSAHAGPLSPVQQAATWSAPVDAPRHSHSHCSSSSHSSSDYGSSHSHSYDSGCSSSDSGSSSSSSD